LNRDAFRKLKVHTAACPKYVLNRIVKQGLGRALNFIKKTLMSPFRMQCDLLAWEQRGVIPARTVAQKDLSSNPSLNTLDTTGKVSEIMLPNAISILRSHGLLT